MHGSITSNTSTKKMGIHSFDEYAMTTRRLRAIEGHLFSEMKGEGVILSLKNGKYYGVNTVGASIWKAIQNSTTFQEIQSSVMQEYDVDDITCRKEVLSFLEKMVKEELIEILDEKTS